MILNILFSLAILPQLLVPIQPQAIFGGNHVLASHEISLNERYADEYVNGVFKDNILLTLAYLNGTVKQASDINWSQVQQPQKYEFQLEAGRVFAFHEDVLVQFQGQKAVTTNAHFSYQEGFKSDGLVGDGVCHLASLMNWVAQTAGLSVVAPTNHDFASIPQVDRIYGTSIYYYPGKTEANAQQNLYITNTLDDTIRFVFVYDGKNLKLTIQK